MATAEECRKALERLAGRISELDPEARAAHLADRSISCTVSDLGITFVTQLGPDGAGPVTEADGTTPRANVRFLTQSDDLLAIADDPAASAGPGSPAGSRSRRACSTCSACASCSDLRPSRALLRPGDRGIGHLVGAQWCACAGLRRGDDAAAAPRGCAGILAAGGAYWLRGSGRAGARGGHGLVRGAAAPRGAGRPSADPQRLPGAPVRHHRPDRARGDRVAVPRQAPADPGRGRRHRAHPPEDGRLVAGPPGQRAASRRAPDPAGAGQRRLAGDRLPARHRRGAAHRPGGRGGRPSRAGPARPGLGPGRGGPPAARRPGSGRSARRCWTSATWPASATCTSAEVLFLRGVQPVAAGRRGR